MCKSVHSRSVNFQFLLFCAIPTCARAQGTTMYACVTAVAISSHKSEHERRTTKDNGEWTLIAADFSFSPHSIWATVNRSLLLWFVIECTRAIAKLVNAECAHLASLRSRPKKRRKIRIEMAQRRMEHNWSSSAKQVHESVQQTYTRTH